MPILKNIISYLFLSLAISSCGPKQLTKIPPISSKEIQNFSAKEHKFSRKIQKFLEESIPERASSKTSSLSLNNLAQLAEDWIKPKYLNNFSNEDIEHNMHKDTWVKFLGNYGSCHQLRVFYKFQDPLFLENKWMSSVLSVPAITTAQNTVPGLILAPTLDGPNYLLEPAFWSFLCKSGVASLMPESIYKRNTRKKWTKHHFDPSPDIRSIDDLTIFEESLKRYVSVLEKNREILKTINALPTEYANEFFKDLLINKVSNTQHALWASSLGSFASSILVAKDDSLKGAVLGVGGGNIPYILSHSQIKVFQETRTLQTNYFNLQNNEDYQKLLTANISFDPIDFARKNLSDKLFMYIADKDTSVPTDSQYELWEAFGKPEMENLNKGHIGALLYVAWVSKNIKEKGLKKLKSHFTEL